MYETFIMFMVSISLVGLLVGVVRYLIKNVGTDDEQD